MKRFNISVNGKTYDVLVEETEIGSSSQPTITASAPAIIAPAPSTTEKTPTTKPVTAVGAVGTEKMTAPMPGAILDVKVKAGESVKSGQVLVVLEAMKMENEIMSPRDAVIAGVHVAKGDSVNSGDILVSLE